MLRIEIILCRANEYDAPSRKPGETRPLVQHTKKNEVAGEGTIISCRICHHECTQLDFESHTNLCDHLSLDALAATIELLSNVVYAVTRRPSWYLSLHQ